MVRRMLLKICRGRYLRNRETAELIHCSPAMLPDLPARANDHAKSCIYWGAHAGTEGNGR